MRVYIAGQGAFGAGVLRMCLDIGYEVVGVACPLLSGAVSTDGVPHPDTLRAAAEWDHVPATTTERLAPDDIPTGTDVILAAHSHHYFGRAVRDRARFGALGYHPSLLPLHRGRDAVRWAVHLRERVTGGTCFWLDDGVDTGDVAAQDFVLLRPRDTASSLWRRDLFPMGLRLFARCLALLERGVVTRIPQDPALATWEPSWARPPLHRPGLLMLTDGRPGGYRVIRDREEAARALDVP